MTSPKLSVVTINYNNAAGLAKTIASVFELKSRIGKQIQYIVIDGDSNDGSQRLCEESADLIDYYLCEPDSGIFNAMNKGLRYSKGEYLIFMNSGDTFYLPSIDIDFLDNSLREDIHYGNVILETSGQHKLLKQTQSLDFFYLLNKTICHQSIFYRTQILQKYPFTEEKEFSVLGDWIQLFEIFKNEKDLKVVYEDRIICYYNTEGESDKVEGRRGIQRRLFLSKYYSEWELESMFKIARIRGRSYYFPFLVSLEGYIETKVFALAGILLKCIGRGKVS